MLILLICCTLGTAFAGNGYHYPKPSNPFPDPECPPGSNGVFPNCEPVAPVQSDEKSTPQETCPPGTVGNYPNCITPPCPPGFSGLFPNCQKPVKQESCPPGTVGTFPNCITPPCPPGFTGQFPDCKEPVKQEECPTGTVGTFPNCITPPCPPGFTGQFPDCQKAADPITPQCPEGSTGEYPTCGYLPPPPATGKCVLNWEDFKTTFNKTYANKTEEEFRQHVFKENQELILAHNPLYEQGLETYSLCMNSFGDWTHSEFLAINGFVISDDDDSDDDHSDDEHSASDHSSADHHSADGYPANDHSVSHDSIDDFPSDPASPNENEVDGSNDNNAAGQGRSLGSEKTPDSKDWRKEGAVTPVKHQMACASCWAFSAAGSLEGQFFLKNGILNSLSEQQLVDCSVPYGNNGCNMGSVINAFRYTQNDGIVTDDTYSYEAKDNRCRHTDRSAPKNKNYVSLPKGDEKVLKDAVANIGPISVGIDAAHRSFVFYSEGVYFNPECTSKKVNHAVVAIGYDHDDATGLDYWIIKNSYGTTWGDGGYGKVARNKDNHCAIASSSSYPVV